MIIKVKRGDSAEALLIYQRRLEGTPEEQAGARLFAMNGIRDVDSAAAVLNRAAMRSGRAAPIVHIIIRAERGLSDDEWRTAINAALEEAGLASQAWAAFRHNNDDDDPGDHMHIAAVAADRHGAAPSRILRSKSLGRQVSREEAKTLPKGDVVSRAWDSHLGRRLMTVARHLEDEFGLRPLARDRNVLAEPCRTVGRVSQGERDRERRTGIAPLADLLDLSATQAALDERDYDARRIALAALDLELRPFIRKNGDLIGLRLHRISDPTRHCPASALGDRYSLKAMDARSPVTFVHWYRSHPTTPEVAAAPAVEPAETLRRRYEEYVRDLVARQQRLREERITVAAWQKRERGKALARRKAAMPVTRSRSTRVHRAAAMTTYRLECERIDKEAARQRDAIDGRQMRRLDFVDWLETQADADPVAARKLLQLRERGAVVRSAQPAPAMSVSTAPSPQAASTARSYSPTELAAMVAEQERLKVAAATLMAEASILRQHTAVAALAKRLSKIGVELILEADRQTQRVRVERDAIKVDDATMMSLPASPSAHAVLEQAKATHLTQVQDEAVLAVVIRHAAGFAPQRGEDPASWLQRFWKMPVPTRWLTPAQDKAIRRGWQVDDEQHRERRDDAPPTSTFSRPEERPNPRPMHTSTPASTATTTHAPAPASSRPPSPTTVSAPTRIAAGSPTISPHAQEAATSAGERRADSSLPVASAAARPSKPTPTAGSQPNVPHAEVLAAMAMMKAPRSPAGAPGRSADLRAPVSEETAPRHEANVVSTAPPRTLPSIPTTAASAPATLDNQDLAPPTPREAPVAVPADRIVTPRPVVKPSVSLIAKWLAATYDARTDAAQRDSQALAARLLEQDDLAILDADLRARAIREADAHHRRLADERRLADAAKSPPLTSVMEQEVAASTSPAVETTAAAKLHRRAAAWQLGQAGDPMKR
jgi:hypothetical protein